MTGVRLELIRGSRLNLFPPGCAISPVFKDGSHGNQSAGELGMHY